MIALRKTSAAALLGAALVAYALYVPAKAALAQVLLERAWLRVEAGETNARPWPWADMSPLGEIEVPRLHARAIVLEGASGQAMAFGPGHMPNTPMIGARGTAIIAAHRDTQFAMLKDMRKGDIVTAATRGGRTTFRIVSMEVVKADASGLDPAYGGKSGVRLALVTCWPFDGVLHSPWRYVVLAERVLTGPGPAHRFAPCPMTSARPSFPGGCRRSRSAAQRS